MQDFKKTKEYRIYQYLTIVFNHEPTRWVDKETIVNAFPDIFTKNDATSHDICSTLNLMRLRINDAASRGEINGVVILNNNRFKIAKDEEEAKKYCQRDYENGIKLLVRYYKNIGIIKETGQGTFIDENGNVVDIIKFADPFLRG